MNLIPRSELTPEQLRAVELPYDQHRVFIGGPGSGKTQVLLHRAAHLKRAMGTLNGDYHIFVFTRALREYLRSACTLLDLNMDCVDTFDGWCCKTYRKYLGRLPYDKAAGRVDYTAVRTAVYQEFEEGETDPIFDFVLVDEGQDLTANAFDVMRRLGQHITVCIDHKQQIYEKGSDEREILSHLRLKKHNLSLLATYRCTPYIVDIASRLVPESGHRQEFVNQCRIDGSGREQPLLYIPDNFEDEKRRLAEILRSRISRGEKVAVLVPRRKQMYGFTKGLGELGFEVETKNTLDFTSNRPKVLTYQSAKGLTFDSVLMPRLVRTSFTRESADLIERLMFVGITRAMKWVYLSSTDPNSLFALQKIGEAEETRSLVIQTTGQSPVVATTATNPSPQHQSADDGLLDLL